MSGVGLLRQLRKKNFRDTCTITPAVADGETPVPVTVKCNVIRPSGSGAGQGGGGAQLSRPSDLTAHLPYGTVVKNGFALTWNEENRTFSVGEVTLPNSLAGAVLAQLVGGPT